MQDIKKAVQASDKLVAWNMLESASNVLEQCLQEHPRNPNLLRRLGKIRLHQGQTHEAVPYLEKALAQDRLLRKVTSTNA